MQDRVPTTAGESNVFLDKWAVARVSYHTVALAGWTQPVRYSPYPRNTDGGRERFGCEKDGSVAGECEVHVHVGFPIPAREHAKIAPPPRCSLGRRMSLAGTEMSGLSSRRPRLSIRGDPVSPNPAILAAGFEDMLSVNRVGYVARRIGYDAEECIQKALEDNEIEVCKPSGDGHRRYGVYRLTAKGREALVKHMREAFQRSAEAAGGGAGRKRVRMPCQVPLQTCPGCKSSRHRRRRRRRATDVLCCRHRSRADRLCNHSGRTALGSQKAAASKSFENPGRARLPASPPRRAADRPVCRQGAGRARLPFPFPPVAPAAGGAPGGARGAQRPASASSR